MIDAHAQALIDVLRASGLTVGDGSGEGLTRPYVTVDVLSGRAYTTSLDGDQDGRALPVPLTLVGDSPRACRWLADRVEAALLDRRLVVNGRTTAPMTRTSATAPDVDNKLQPSAWWTTEIWNVSSVRAQEPA